jgi:purine-binding chemotaxis protein CheW
VSDFAGQYCTFQVDGELYGVDVNDVQEIVLHQEMTPAPLAPAAVKGLINLRGQVVIAIDLRTVLGLASLEDARQATNVVISGDRGAVSLLVDEIGDVLDLSSGFEPPPPTLRGPHRQLLKAVCTLDDKVLHILDVQAAIDVKAA